MYPQGVCRIRKPAYAGNGCAIFLVFQTEEVGQKDGCGSQAQLRGVAKRKYANIALFTGVKSGGSGDNAFNGGIAMNDKQYARLVKDKSPKSPIMKDCLFAFASGGLICALGQFLLNRYTGLGLEKQDAAAWVSITLVGLSALLTGLSVYDDIAKYAGAGTLVPITGFSNAVAASAVEFQTEGFILGVGAKMFTIAGPVIVYGLSASAVYGVIYWLFTAPW